MRLPLSIKSVEDAILVKDGLMWLVQVTPFKERGPCQELLDGINQHLELELKLKERDDV